ncbi:hypothetical protein T4E_5136 [Trichinella pseudospiralis]|nr:hypothetical protein T4E_5136 [Trichinella pseudospiralis]
MDSKEIQFVSTERNHKICSTLKLTNKSDTYWMCAEIFIGCHGRIPANLVNTKKMHKPDQLRPGDPRPVQLTYDKLASNTFTSL